jgi:uncharacterized protein
MRPARGQGVAGGDPGRWSGVQPGCFSSGNGLDQTQLERFRAKWTPGSREENASKQQPRVFGSDSIRTGEKDMTMLREDINNAVKEAMKAKEERKLATLRMVNSTIKNADIEARGQGKPPLSDADLLSVFQKMIKQRQEAVELYEKGGRSELAAQERAEIAIISAYLPKQMSEEDVKAAIAAVIAETNAAGMKDMGKVISALKAKYAGQMDFGKASGLVKAALSS